MKKSISIVIPTYKGKGLLQKHLPSVIAALNAVDPSGEIIIVDDCSKDDTVLFLESTYPQLIIIQNETNLGFGYTANRGVAVAKGDLVLLLNNDIDLPPDYFHSQLRYFDNAATFGVCARLVNKDSSLQEAGWYPYYKKHKIRWKIFNIENEPKSPIPTFYLCGGNALIDKNKFLRLGGFSGFFAPFYSEDVDLSIRAWRSGFELYFDPQASCLHEKAATIDKHHQRREIDILCRRNSILLQIIHAQGKLLMYWRVKVFLYRLLIPFLSSEKINRHALKEVIKTYPEAMKANKQFSIGHSSLKKVVGDLQQRLNSLQITGL